MNPASIPGYSLADNRDSDETSDTESIQIFFFF